MSYVEMNFLNGGGGASSADKVSYDNTISGLESDNVQDAIDEVSSELGYLMTEETVCGIYIDENGVKHKIYRTIVKTTTPLHTAPGNVKMIPFNTATQIDTVLAVKGVMHQSAGYFQPLPVLSNTLNGLCKAYISKPDLSIVVFNNMETWDNEVVILIFEYTKTTD